MRGELIKMRLAFFGGFVILAVTAILWMFEVCNDLHASVVSVIGVVLMYLGGIGVWEIVNHDPNSDYH